MAQDWSELVLGGIDKPRFLLCRENWENNPYFNDGTAGSWIKNGSNGTMEVIEDDNAYGQNVLRYYYVGALNTVSDYIEREWNVTALAGGTCFGKKFILSIRIKSIAAVDVIISDGGGSVLESIKVNNTLEKFEKTFVISGKLSSTSASIYAVIRSTIYGAGFDFSIDHMFFSLVDDDLTIPQPNTSKLIFKENMTGSNEKWDGSIQRFDRKWIPIYYGNWKYLSVTTEYFRQKLYENSNIFCIPHIDVTWGFVGIFEDDFERQYSFDKFFGHKGGIIITGTEFINKQNLPKLQSGTGMMYLDAGELSLDI